MYEELIKSLRKEAEDTYHFLPKILCLQAADAIEKLQKENQRLHAFNAMNLEAREMLHERIKELTDTNVGKWISVDERLPKEKENVLCLCWGNRVRILYLDGEAWVGFGAYIKSFVTHWMPLPSTEGLKND